MRFLQLIKSMLLVCPLGDAFLDIYKVVVHCYISVI